MPGGAAIHPRPLPLWQQVVDMIQRNVEEGHWPVGHRIPSERELCQQHGVSRTTVRLAIAEAVSRGLLHRVHGKGTFVARPKIHQPLVQVTPFAAALRAQGLVPRTRLLAVMTQPADPATAHMLGLPTGQEIMRFRLLGLGSGEPVAAYHSTVPAALGEAVLERLEADAGADRFRLVVDVLAETFGWSHLTAEQTFEAAGASAEEARLLGLPRGAPVLVVTSLVRNPAGRTVEFARAVYRADQYRFHLTRQIEVSGQDHES
ncbi:GntR family transcriptional regulator [Symbiobacterium thermophilum]|uniref:GntR family transcriptional regulator n=2 Tax=Symbiobacterium thermophilum TaxID=2734 RepID=Q67LW3_SYMTH|nr:GntR family transcriptional regulator [Symbiobacterium thermophilum]BAD41333.1 GntR family transcriptional regulator [Symbiobacterium thermophilum IAM 14863]